MHSKDKRLEVRFAPSPVAISHFLAIFGSKLTVDTIFWGNFVQFLLQIYTEPRYIVGIIRRALENLDLGLPSARRIIPRDISSFLICSQQKSNKISQENRVDRQFRAGGTFLGSTLGPSRRPHIREEMTS